MLQSLCEAEREGKMRERRARQEIEDQDEEEKKKQKKRGKSRGKRSKPVPERKTREASGESRGNKSGFSGCLDFFLFKRLYSCTSRRSEREEKRKKEREREREELNYTLTGPLLVMTCSEPRMQSTGPNEGERDGKLNYVSCYIHGQQAVCVLFHLFPLCVHRIISFSSPHPL